MKFCLLLLLIFIPTFIISCSGNDEFPTCSSDYYISQIQDNSLMCSIIDLSFGGYYSGAGITISEEVGNNSDNTLKNINVGLYLSKDSNFNSEKYLIGSRNISILTSNSTSINLNCQYTLPYSFSTGRFYVGLIITYEVEGITNKVFTANYSLPYTVYIEKKAIWTLMVYLNADNTLDKYGMLTFNQLEAINNLEGKLDIIVLFDRFGISYSGSNCWSDTRLYKVVYDPLGKDNIQIVSTRLSCPSLNISSDVDTELDMAEQSVLSNFINYCTEYYPANNYAMILWGHGNGWQKNELNISAKQEGGLTKDLLSDQTNNSIMKIKTLRQAIETTHLNFNVICFDTCLMGMIEVAYELKNCSKIMIASENIVPAESFPYTDWLNLFLSGIDYSYNSFCSSLKESYFSFYNNRFNGSTLSSVDLTKMNILSNQLNVFLNELLTIEPTVIINQRLLTQEFLGIGNSDNIYCYMSDGGDYIDLYDFVSKFSSSISTSDLLMNISESVLYETHYGTTVSNAKGLSIYYPRNIECIALDYTSSSENLFLKDSNWLGFVNNTNYIP